MFTIKLARASRRGVCVVVKLSFAVFYLEFVIL